MIANRKTYKKRGIFSKLFANKKLSALLFVVLFGAVGGVYIWRSSAASPYIGMANYKNEGYWTATADGAVHEHGNVKFYGSPKKSALTLTQAITDIAARTQGDGYWLLGGDGGVFAYGSAKSLGRAPEWGGEGYYKAIVSTPSGDGYWVISKLGTVYEFGDAKNTFKVSYAPSDTNYEAAMGTIKGVDTIVDADRTPSGKGLYMLDKTGKVWAAGQEAKNNVKANAKMEDGEFATGIAAGNTTGYIVSTNKGGVRAYGSEVKYVDNRYGKSDGGIVGIQKVGLVSNNNVGYWLVSANGGIFAFGSAHFYSSDWKPAPVTPPPATGGGSSGGGGGGSICPYSGSRYNLCITQVALNNLGEHLVLDGLWGTNTEGACNRHRSIGVCEEYLGGGTGGGGSVSITTCAQVVMDFNAYKSGAENTYYSYHDRLFPKWGFSSIYKDVMGYTKDYAKKNYLDPMSSALGNMKWYKDNCSSKTINLYVSNRGTFWQKQVGLSDYLQRWLKVLK